MPFGGGGKSSGCGSEVGITAATSHLSLNQGNRNQLGNSMGKLGRQSVQLVVVALFAGFGACVLQTETAPGPRGEMGPPGGSVDPEVLATLQTQIQDLQARVDVLERRASDPECPLGYGRDPSEGVGSAPPVHCRLTTAAAQVYDEVVKVSSGGAAFWIDRYEATVWLDSQTATRWTSEAFPVNGQVDTVGKLLYARSVKGQALGRSTWFQAQGACAGTGKRLPTDAEWTLAATGTPDPISDSDGSAGTCLTSAAGPRETGLGEHCASIWGAEDMIGNLDEWTATWYAGVNDFSAPVSWSTEDAGSEYANDRTYNLTGVVEGPAGHQPGLPAASRRGGYWSLGMGAGVFTMFLLTAPSSDGSGAAGFRCVVPR